MSQINIHCSPTSTIVKQNSQITSRSQIHNKREREKKIKKWVQKHGSFHEVGTHFVTVSMLHLQPENIFFPACGFEIDTAMNLAKFFQGALYPWKVI